MPIVCKTCFREYRDPSFMQKNASGEISDQCKTCYDMIGKGPGYSSLHTDAEVEIWFEGTKERREKIEKLLQ